MPAEPAGDALRQPAVLWAGVAPQPGLGVLRDRVRGAVRRAGVDLPRERFRPHVTLARLRNARVGDVVKYLGGRGDFRTLPLLI